MRKAHEGFQALFDIGQDHELVHDRVGRLGGNDAGLGDSDITSVLDSLLGMADGRTLHRALHGSGPTAGTDVEAAQAHLVTNFLGVLVLFGADRVATPTHYEVGAGLVVEDTGIAQHVKYCVGDG